MKNHFDPMSTTTAQIDAKLYHDILAHEDKMFKVIITCVFVLMFLFRGWIGYWLKFGVAIPSQVEFSSINIQNEPLQKDYKYNEGQNKSFVYKSLINNYKVKLIPQAHYKLSGLVVVNNHDSIFTKDFFASTVLYDLGTTWGDLGDKNFFNKYFQCFSAKNELYGSRNLWLKSKTRNLPVSVDYITSHWAQSHIIPANRNIMAALLKIKRYEKVELEGELVDIEYKNARNYTYHYETSTSRTDMGANGNRGNGSAEVFYVTKVKIGSIIYK